ncbi:MAG: CotH kinase family protein [Lewinella sp.]|nr:CotH kinase family protein [Lewinella sp.]
MSTLLSTSIRLKIRGFGATLLGLTFTVATAQNPFPDPGPAYRDEVVPRIDIMLPADSLAVILAPGNEESDYHFHATFQFDDGTVQETVDNVGFRLRGNTSRYSPKKSFKVSFNTYEPGRKWYGVEKLNLNGEHNDPTVIRSKICWDLLREIGVPAPRANFVRLYINGAYFGVYANIEHIDEEFVGTRFGNKDGNLYKCLWPADLDFLGPDPDAYKLMSGGRRVYELKTNEEVDDYTDLAHFIDVLNNTPLADLPCELEPIFNVDTYLLAMAFDVLAGNWDGPLYNKNNFYLYHNEATGRFEYIPYDLDNTFGIDWFNINWAERNMYTWGHPNEPRPLYWRLLEVPVYRARYTYFMERIVDEIYTVPLMVAALAEFSSLIEPYILSDPYYPLSYGFDLNDFAEGLVQALPYGHTPIGFQPFILSRRSATLAQLEDSDMAPIIRPAAPPQALPNAPFALLANVEDDEGVTEVTLCYQPEGAPDFTCIPMFDDGQQQDGAAGDGQYGAWLPTLESDGLLTYYFEATDGAGQLSRAPVCGTEQLFVGSSAVTLAINELMASNDATVTDEFGEYEDWVEIYNYGSSPVSLAGRYLSDNPDDPTKWAFPDRWLAAGEFLLIWTDDDEAQGELHTSFKLSADGEYIGIFDTDERANALIDGVAFDALATDVAYGRLPNGTGPFMILPATPGSSNEEVNGTDEPAMAVFSYRIYPNPTTGWLRLRADRPLDQSVPVMLFNANGQVVRQASWRDQLTLDLTDLPAGSYWLAMRRAGELTTLGQIVKE